MMLMVLAALAVFQAEEPRQVPGPATDQTFIQARSALDEALLDYPSARFREVTANAAFVCGKVNAKNRMGAYSGWSSFVVVMKPSAQAFVGNDEVLVEAFCTAEVLPRSPDYSARLATRP
ncbi:MAG TPA: hypothetical protein VN018_09250 [Brevundimonas sp.]|nr:hypothetical protein [Brevundimonas sp.]